MPGKPKLGISACLLGERVRYDGQHKYDAFLVEMLGRYAEYVPVCPEVACGLPVPRESMHLEGDPAKPRLLTTRTRKDLTGQMLDWVAKRVEELADEGLCGFVFKSKSPSSGMERVKVYNDKGGVIGSAPGLFAREFIKGFPLLPVEDEGRLNDPNLRANFIERVFTLNRYRTAIGGRKTPANLMEFHAAHKYLLLAHSEKHMRAMGRLTADANARTIGDVCRRYEELLLEGMKTHATPKRHANVLEHILGFFKDELTSAEKKELLGLIDEMRKGNMPLIATLTLVKHYVSKYNVAYLHDQIYLSPSPAELALLYHA
ncbi:MAG: DUF1722 domain-containing protein [Verrucomicrobia bacterium]|nr:DUF1722 domain-containing protein [Verrucomicrobiota bacterium]